MQPPNAEPLAVETLAGALKQRFGNQINVELLMLDERDDPDGSKLADRLASRSAIDIVGLSIPQSTYFLALGFLNRLREILISPLIVLGHALPTHAPDAFLSNFPDALIVRGWGETAICDIVEQYRTGSPDWYKVHSLMFMQGGRVITTPVVWPRTLSSPLRFRPLDFFVRIESSRGCHYDVCTFCTRQPRGSKTSSWFRFPVDLVLKEVAYLQTQGITKFTFADEDFVGNDLEGAENIAYGLKEIGGMQFSLSLRVDNVYNPNESDVLASRRLNLFHLLKDAGLSLVYFGVESLSDTQLKRYGKGVRAKDSVRAVEAIEEIGIPMELGYILFDPLLTVSELQENVHWLTTRSFSKYIGQLFNNLRVQRDTAFANLLKYRGLLGEFNPNTIEYNYKYQDHTVAKIATICLKWKEEIDEVYALARNVQRTDFNSTHCEIFVRQIRLLELDMLKQLLSSIYIKNDIKIDSYFLYHRYNLVDQLKQKIRSSQITSPSIHFLSLAIDRFLEQKTEIL